MLKFLWFGFRDVWSVFGYQARIIWFLLRWPLLVITIGLFCLQVLAISYTATSTVFLSSFCQQELPTVRNWLCRSWDQRLNTLPQNPSAANLNQPLKNILQSRERTISYVLPHHLARYEAKIRSFRASLPESKCTLDDQSFFREAFTGIIDECHASILAAQLFHAHIVGAMDTQISDTKYVVHRLDTGGFLSPYTRTSRQSFGKSYGMAE